MSGKVGSNEAAVQDFWAVYDSHFEELYRHVIDATRDHPVLGAYIRTVTVEQIGAMAKEYCLLVQRSIEGDSTSRDAYLRQIAHAYADAGISFAEWSAYDSSLVDLLTPLIVATYGNEPPRMIAALKAMREFTHRTTVVLGGAYIEEKERALVESEARYRQLVDRSPEAIVVQVEGRVAFANDSAAQALGFADRSELVGRHLADLRSAHNAGGAPLSLARAPGAAGQAGDAPVESVERYKRSDGREVTLEVRSIPIVYEGREATFAVAHNVTERLEAEAARRRALAAVDLERRRLAAILDALPIGIWIADADGRVSYTNPGAAQVFGGRAPRPSAIERYGDEYRATWPATGNPVLADEWPLACTLRTGEPVVRQPIDVFGFDGKRAHVLFSSVPIPGGDGESHGAILVGLDISDQRRSLREREQLLASLEIAAQRTRAQFKAMPVPTYAWQRRVHSDGAVDFVLHDYNDAAMLATRGSVARTVGSTAAALLGSSADAMVADMAASLEEGRAIRREVTFAMPAGEPRRFLTTYSGVPPDLVLAHTEDITERLELEEQLRSAQKMEAIGRLAGGVAHDFNNILSVILGYTSLMIDDLAVDDPMRNDVVEVATAAQRAVALTQQLLALGRRQVLQPQSMDLVASVRGLEPMLRRLLGESIEMSTRTGAAVGGVFADPTQIDQVIMNLVVNARDAMPTGGRLTIEIDDVTFDHADAARDLDIRPERYVMLAVTDSGTGMDTATLAKIFEPFFTTKEEGKGTGLGLATVFGVVRQSDGVVRAESEVGKGTTMRVYLPRVDGERCEGSKPPSPSPRAHAPRGKETILLVEDDLQVRVLAGNVLRRQGYKVLEADNAAEAILLSGQYEAPIDLLLTDVVMPRMSGRELADRLAPVRPQMKVLFMSGYTDDAVVRHGVATSGRAFLQKPVTAIELARKVQSVIDAAAPAVVYPKPLA